MKSLQFVTALHGDEIIPVAALSGMGISQIIGNPRAYVKQKRYIDSDLNSAFGKKPMDQETKRAGELLKMIDLSIPVVDLHTFTNPSPPFVIVVDLEMVSLAKMTGIKRVVYMKHNIKVGGALINHRSGISVEVGRHKKLSSYNQTKKLVRTLQKRKEHEIELYEVYGVIKEKDQYKNFEMHTKGFYPVLAGQSSYGFYGLKAKRVE